MKKIITLCFVALFVVLASKAYAITSSSISIFGNAVVGNAAVISAPSGELATWSDGTQSTWSDGTTATWSGN